MHIYLFRFIEYYIFQIGRIQLGQARKARKNNFDQSFQMYFPLYIPVNVFSRLYEDYNRMINQILKFWKTWKHIQIYRSPCHSNILLYQKNRKCPRYSTTADVNIICVYQCLLPRHVPWHNTWPDDTRVSSVQL